MSLVRLEVSDWLRLGRALHSRFVLRQCVEVGLAPDVVGVVWVHDGGHVRIGDRVHFRAGGTAIELHAYEGAEIILGNDVIIEGGVSIEAHRSVTVGDGAVLEGFCKVFDSPFQATRGERQRRPEPSPVVIGPGVTIGRRAIIFPGAHVLAGTVVPAGALVRHEPRVTVSPRASVGG